jgi:alkylation response protein AidB-like acyl-CoA dehydrogenase
MTTLTLELAPELYEQLRAEAERHGKTAQAMAQDWLTERLTPPIAPPGERERAVEALRAAGLLAELSPEEKQLAHQSTATLEEVQEALNRAGGKPLSEIVLEMRGPKA